jgi:hypothetical protein
LYDVGLLASGTSWFETLWRHFKRFWCSAKETVFCWVFDFVLIQFGVVFIVAREGCEYKFSCVGGDDISDRKFYQSN